MKEGEWPWSLSESEEIGIGDAESDNMWIGDAEPDDDSKAAEPDDMLIGEAEPDELDKSVLEQYLHCTGKCLYPAHLLLCSSTSSN